MATGHDGEQLYKPQRKTLQRSRHGDKRCLPKKLEAQLKGWDAKLDVLSAKAQKATADDRINYENVLERLKSKRAAAHKMLEDMGKHGENAWEDMKDGVEKAWDEMSKAIEKVAARFK